MTGWVLPWTSTDARFGGRAVWLADVAGEVAYDAVDWTRPSALIVGGEAAGSGPDAIALATGSALATAGVDANSNPNALRLYHVLPLLSQLNTK